MNRGEFMEYYEPSFVIDIWTAIFERIKEHEKGDKNDKQ